jgi:hypothetical protein
MFMFMFMFGITRISAWQNDLDIRSTYDRRPFRKRRSSDLREPAPVLMTPRAFFSRHPCDLSAVYSPINPIRHERQFNFTAARVHAQRSQRPRHVLFLDRSVGRPTTARDVRIEQSNGRISHAIATSFSPVQSDARKVAI